MASSASTQAPTAAPTELLLPVPAIICIAIGAYIVVVVLILVVRQILLQRGVCAGVYCCGKEGEPCCACCVECAESCDCCRSPSLDACLDAICPKRKQTDCADIIMCRCCSDPNSSCCGGQDPLCDCGNCDCTCNCQGPECDSINCCCFQIGLRQPQGEGLMGEGYPTSGYQPMGQQSGPVASPRGGGGGQYPPSSGGGWGQHHSPSGVQGGGGPIRAPPRPSGQYTSPRGLPAQAPRSEASPPVHASTRGASRAERY